MYFVLSLSGMLYLQERRKDEKNIVIIFGFDFNPDSLFNALWPNSGHPAQRKDIRDGGRDLGIQY